MMTIHIWPSVIGIHYEYTPTNVRHFCSLYRSNGIPLKYTVLVIIMLVVIAYYMPYVHAEIAWFTKVQVYD